MGRVRAWTVGETWAGRQYLENTTRTVAVTLLTLTPENAVEVREAAGRMAHASARGDIVSWVETEAARLKRRDLSSAFYPTGIEVATNELAAEVTGNWSPGSAGKKSRARTSVTGWCMRWKAGRIGLLRFRQTITSHLDGVHFFLGAASVCNETEL